MKIRIYYHHTDAGGVVYYANYLNFLEEARTEYLAERGVSVQGYAKQGTLFVVARQEIDYKLPAVYGDLLDIHTKISNVSGVRMEYDYEIKNQNNKTVCCAKTIAVCIGKDFKPKPIPEEIRKKIS